MRSRTTSLLLLAIAALAPAGPLIAQVAPTTGAQNAPAPTTRSPMATGTRVRVQASGLFYGHRVTGSVLAMSADSLQLQPDGTGGPTSIPLSAVTRIEVSRGMHSNRGKGAAVGARIGGAVGLLFGIAVAWNSCDTSSGYCVGGDGPRDVPLAALSGVIWGGAIGALVSGGRRERWERVSLQAVRVSVAPQKGGLALAASVRF